MMRQRQKSYEMDMVNGPIFSQVLRFALPLMLSGILQLLYNAADVVVVGRFAGPTALAAVSSTGARTGLIVNVFMGLSVGTSVVVAQNYGANRYKDVSETVHTAISVSLLAGVVVALFGILAAKPLLQLMKNPADVIDQSALYMRIYFAGMPVNMVYNFGSAVLRAVGDTKRPLYFLTIAGIVNVLLNLFFVIVLHMGVAGVATATVLSQVVSVVLTILCLIRSEGSIHLDLKKLRIHKDKLIQIARIGLPAGVQGSLFSISNVLIQSSINAFGSTVMAANGAAGNLEGFVYVGMNAFHQAALSFSGQNVGARRYDRLGRILIACVSAVSVIGLVLGVSAYLAGDTLLAIYTTEAEVVTIGKVRLLYLCVPYLVCGIMDVLAGQLRGMGCSLVPTIVTILGVCGIRIAWIYTVFAHFHTLQVLYLSYPVSWAVTAAAHLVTYFIVRRRMAGDAARAA